ncbi:MAG: hypothetical protein XD92_0461 [Proteiniphilum acetatigenes]|jgi:hypothetical protein|uniref:Uncharacterized protein n=1 Tax=Proteiniphilum acetatigenes TaxID=294710 RepID=A0A101HJY1_9BACT|nr:MAG: hypothetical protein XD92_0461 [Proteiniphilum acetatigenes]
MYRNIYLYHFRCNTNVFFLNETFVTNVIRIYCNLPSQVMMDLLLSCDGS